MRSALLIRQLKMMPGCSGQIPSGHAQQASYDWETSQAAYQVAACISVLSFCRHPIDHAIALAHGCCLNFRKVRKSLEFLNIEWY